MECANTYYLNQYLAEQDAKELEREAFDKRCEELEQEIIAAGPLGVGSTGIMEVIVDNADDLAPAIIKLLSVADMNEYKEVQSQTMRILRELVKPYAEYAAEKEFERAKWEQGYED